MDQVAVLDVELPDGGGAGVRLAARSGELLLQGVQLPIVIDLGMLRNSSNLAAVMPVRCS